jgi:sn-glycerol 3-phosphate transport system substrate-binding protein
MRNLPRDPAGSARAPIFGRRTSALTALLCVGALLAAACGGDSEDRTDGTGERTDNPAAGYDCPVGAHEEAGSPVEVTVWHPYNALTQETLEGIARDYNASQDVVTVRIEAQGTYEELLSKYESAIGDPATLPDIIFNEDTTTQFMIDSGTAMPAAACIEADPESAGFYDDVVPSVANAYTVQDVLWPAAFGVSMPIMYVNDDHLRAAGVDTEDYPATLEELRTAAEQISAANLAGMDAPIAISLNSWFVENWLTGAGQPIVNQQNGRDGLATDSEFDNESTLEIFEWIQSMSDDGLLKTLPLDGFDQYFALARQSSSILIDGSRAITSITAVIDGARAEVAGVDPGLLDDADLQGLDVNVAPIAGLDEAGQGGVGGSAGYVVAGADDASVAASWDFLKFFNSIDNQVRWTLEGSYLPVTTSAQDDPRLVEEFESTRSGRWLATAYEQLRTLDPDFPAPVIGPFKEFRSGAQTALERVARTGAEPARVIEEFDERFRADLRSYAQEIGD